MTVLTWADLALFTATKRTKKSFLLLGSRIVIAQHITYIMATVSLAGTEEKTGMMTSRGKWDGVKLRVVREELREGKK